MRAGFKFIPLFLPGGKPGWLGIAVSNEDILRLRAARGRLFLYSPLDRDVHDVTLAIHEQKGKIGGFERIGKATIV